MNGFITKPLSVNRLDAELQTQLEHVAAGGRPEHDSSRAAPDRFDGVPTTEQPVLDASRLDELAEMGVEAEPLVTRAIGGFLDRADLDLTAIETFCASGDAAEVRRVAHGLKGSALNLGAERVAATAHAIEDAAAADDLGVAQALSGRLQLDMADAVRALGHHRLAPGHAGRP